MLFLFKEYVKTCSFCQLHKGKTALPEGYLCSITPPKKTFELVGIDHLGPLKKISLAMYMWSCWLTKRLEVRPVTSTGSDETVSFIEEQVFLRHGLPKRVISDQGTSFTSRVFFDCLQKWGVQHSLASAEHPQTNGLVERANKTLPTTLASFVNMKHDDWDQHLPYAVFAINTARQSSTRLSPFQLLYGREAVLPCENAFPWKSNTWDASVHQRQANQWRKTAHRLLLISQKRWERFSNKYRRLAPIYHPGELVVSRKIPSKGRTRKLLPKFIGPFQIVQRIGKTPYKVEDLPENRKRRIHRIFTAPVSQLRKWHVRDEHQEEQVEENMESAGEAGLEDTDMDNEEFFDNENNNLNSDHQATTRSGKTIRVPAR